MSIRDKRFVILGGGSAGWIAANALVAEWGEKGVDITLVESATIGTVGVGEGSTPRLKIFFDAIGVEESEWMPRCNATYKNGISFAAWSEKPDFERYFHPFPTQVDQHTSSAFYYNSYLRRQGADVAAHPDPFFLSAYLAENKLGPKAAHHFPFLVEYGYHFDANLLGAFLKEKAQGRGVKHCLTNIVEVKQNEQGDIDSLVSESGDVIEGDIFIDCSGFAAKLIQQTLNVPFIEYGENLFNDAAVVLPTPQGKQISSQTVSTALSNGWAWEIPLTNRVGNGYVYSGKYCSADQAETELRAHLGLLESDIEARHLKMKVGRVEKHWYKNCLAVGLSQGFIEPLEATALNLVCNTVYDFMQTYEQDGFTDKGQDAFNQRVNGGYETIRDYIVAHYILNSRTDTEYWRDNGQNTHISPSLETLLECWMKGQDLSQEIERQKIHTSYSALSWYCLFGGYGIYPDPSRLRPPNEKEDRFKLEKINEFIARCGLNFSAHGEQL